MHRCESTTVSHASNSECTASLSSDPFSVDTVGQVAHRLLWYPSPAAYAVIKLEVGEEPFHAVGGLFAVLLCS